MTIRDLRFCELRKVLLGMTVGAEQDALGRLRVDFGIASVRQRAHVHLKSLRSAVAMMPSQGCAVFVVAASETAAPELRHQRQLAPQAARLLGCVALMVVVRVPVFAASRTVFPLSSGKRAATNETAQFGSHMQVIISR